MVMEAVKSNNLPSAHWRIREASPGLKGQEPGALRAKGRKRRISQIKERKRMRPLPFCPT